MSYKNYKACAPEATINKIRNILLEHGIFLREQSFSKDGLYACRVSICSHGLSPLSIGSNGKGRKYEFALASGYAEFMERLQNDLLLPPHMMNYASSSFIRNLPLESKFRKAVESMDLVVEDGSSECKTIAFDDVWQKFGKDLMELFPGLGTISEARQFFVDLYHSDEVNTVPVYSCFEDKVIDYPVQLALLSSGSNGMCAGNTPEEAILQGVCEIFERYASKEIFLRELTPPTIDLNEFVGTAAFAKIKELESKRGYKFIIKDCSLGKKLPVIGLIIINPNNRTYNFKLGSDFVPHIDLERCLTEVYQSENGFIGLPLLHECGMNAIGEFYKMLTTGTGLWPNSIFMNKPSYKFAGFVNGFGLSNSSDLKYACEIIKDFGSQMYIRDNSYLGFPAYYVIVPGMSGVRIDSINLLKENINNGDTISHSIFRKESNDINDVIIDLIDRVEYSLDKDSNFDFNSIIPYYRSKELKDLDPYLFLCMAYYLKEDYRKSLENLRKFLRGKSVQDSYFFAASDYIDLIKIKQCDPEDIRLLLITKYGECIASEIFEDLSSSKDIFKYYNFNNHFNIDSWIDGESYYIGVLKIMKPLIKYRKEHPVNQERLKELFNQI